MRILTIATYACACSVLALETIDFIQKQKVLRDLEADLDERIRAEEDSVEQETPVDADLGPKATPLHLKEVGAES